MNKSVDNLTKEVAKVFDENFGRTPLRQRLEDIYGEATELCRFIDFRNLEEEAGDLLASTLALCAENGWSAEVLVRNTLAKIEKRKTQYKSLGRKVKVALIGGAFNPPTNGHIKLAQFVLNSSKTFDEVFLVPCFTHMYGKKMATPEQRITMCNIAAQVDGRIRVFDYEIKHQLRGETYHFLKRLLAEDFAKDQYDFSYVIGLDNANSFHNWVNYEDLERMMRFVVVGRQGVKRDESVNWYLRPPHIYLSPEKLDIPEISSTHVRDLIKSGTRAAITEFVNPDVLNYIDVNVLYRDVKIADSKIRLWRFSVEGTEDCLYLYSTTSNEQDLRDAFSRQDHGAMEWETYSKLYREGIIEEITSMSQIKTIDIEYIPYTDLSKKCEEVDMMTVEEFLERTK